MSSTVLIGLSAVFSPADLEALVITAAEAVHGHRKNISTCQIDLATRAYALLHDDID